MKKMNWGTGITIVIVVFLVVTIGQVILIHKLIDYDLVVEEYYDAEINYQSQIDKIKRTQDLPEELKISISEKGIEFDFPKIFESKSISGVVNFYKPSDDLLDTKEMIIVDDSCRMFLPKDKFSAGLWKAKVDWSVDGVEYYNEKLLMVN